MKVLESGHQLLTNGEVLAHLNEVKQTSRAENLQTIIVELQAYLRERPAGNVNAPQDMDNIAKFVSSIKENGFKLEKAELLQIINSAPTSLPVLFCLVEEADMRFSEEQLETMLDLSMQYLGSEPVPGEEA